jgi:hypothetical protein
MRIENKIQQRIKADSRLKKIGVYLIDNEKNAILYNQTKNEYILIFESINDIDENGLREIITQNYTSVQNLLDNILDAA